jgi:hypothetical protein
MPHRSAIPATYPGYVAKIELNLPDDLLRRIDNVAEDAGETREETLGRLVEEGATAYEAAFRKKIEDMLGPPVPMGGNAAEIIREMRDNRLPPSMRPRKDHD